MKYPLRCSASSVSFCGTPQHVAHLLDVHFLPRGSIFDHQSDAGRRCYWSTILHQAVSTRRLPVGPRDTGSRNVRRLLAYLITKTAHPCSDGLLLHLQAVDAAVVAAA